MNLFNFKSILDLLQKLPTEEASIKYFAQLRWGDTPICPYCECNKCYDINRNRYKCSKCLKIFTVKVGTIFEGSKISMQKWIMCVYLTSTTTKGISSIQLGKELGVTQKTAWFMAHRIREATNEKLHRKMDNIVEIDETFVGGVEGNKHHSKRLYPGGGTAGKITVLGLLERNGSVQTFVVPSNSKEVLQPIIERNVKTSSIIMSDENNAYSDLKDIFSDHRVVKHGRKVYVSPILVGGIKTHTNTIEGFWSLIKRAIIGIYHYVSRKHLHRYMNDLSFKYNSKEDSVSTIFHGLLWNSLGKRLSYKQLILGL